MNRIRIISTLAAAMLLMVVAGELLLQKLFPYYVGKAYLVVPAFFFILYSTALLKLDFSADAKKNLKQYMAMRTFKLIASLVALLAFGFIFSSQAKGVLIYFLIFYLAMMLLENIFVIYMNKKQPK